MKICILSGIEIPPGKLSVEHYVPRSRIPSRIASLPQNKYPAIKIFNSIKGSFYPCEWEALKYDLCYQALHNYSLKESDRRLIRQALNGMPHINPCEFCVCMLYKDYCTKGR